MIVMTMIIKMTKTNKFQFVELDKSEFVGAMDMDWKDREKSQDQDS